MNENEVWKDVKDYEGLYQVSDRGNVYSVERMDSRGYKISGRILKPWYDRYGYIQVSLRKNGIKKNKRVHRLVAEAFIPNPEKLPQVNHKDENPSNNELSNLEWCDARYNSNYGTARKRAAKKTSKKVKAVNVETGEVVKFNSTREAGRKGYASRTVSKACRGIHRSGTTGKLIGGDGRTYKGFKWYYMEENR